MGISENIKSMRKSHGWTQEQLAERVGVTRATVTQWETGWSQPRMGAVERIAAAFDVSVSDVVADGIRDGVRVHGAKSATGMTMGYVPLRGKVHAGQPNEPDVYEEELVAIPQFLIDQDPDTYACKSEGDCMNRVYPEGCIIAVSPNRPPQNGSVAVVTIDGHDAVMRRMYRTANTLVLSPDSFNPEHDDIIITSNDDRTVEFGGKVVWFQPAEEME